MKFRDHVVVRHLQKRGAAGTQEAGQFTKTGQRVRKMSIKLKDETMSNRSDKRMACRFLRKPVVTSCLCPARVEKA